MRNLSKKFYDNIIVTRYNFKESLCVCVYVFDKYINTLFIFIFDNIITLKERERIDRSLKSFGNNYFITKFSAEARCCGTFFCGGKFRGFIENEVFHGAYARKHEANGKIQFVANLIRSLRSDLYYGARLYLLIKFNNVCFRHISHIWHFSRRYICLTWKNISM